LPHRSFATPTPATLGGVDEKQEVDQRSVSAAGSPRAFRHAKVIPPPIADENKVPAAPPSSAEESEQAHGK